MSELKLPRLLAAAKEFNIGQDTLIEFLSKKGFPKDDLKPTAKLTESQYYALQAEFQSDKVAKNKADHVELPKNAIADKGKKAEEEIAPAKKAVVAETPVVETPKAAKPAEAAPKAANQKRLHLKRLLQKQQHLKRLLQNQLLKKLNQKTIRSLQKTCMVPLPISKQTN